MKILLYTCAFAPKVGGQETIVMQLAEGLAKHNSYSTKTSTVQLTLATPIPADGMNDAALSFSVVREPSLVHLFRLIRDADVVHLAGPVFVPMVLGLLLRKPIVVEHHGFQTVCPNGQLLYEPTQTRCPGHFMASRYRECVRCNAGEGKIRSLKMWLLTFPRRWLCQQVPTNIMPTDWLGTVLRLNRMETIVHGLRPPECAPVKRVAPLVPTFAFLGRLVTTKGARLLLEAAYQLKQKGFMFRVKLIGQGPDRLALEKLAGDLQIGDWVQFLGYIATEKLQESLADATAIIMPSVTGEVFGLVTAENMQQGRLVIVSDIGSLAEVVGDAGMKFSPGDANNLARCMEAVIRNPALIQELGQKAATRISRLFNSDNMVNDHVVLYERLTL